jgi:hypothetical protein
VNGFDAIAWLARVGFLVKGVLGRWLLGVTAAGFVAYGFYEIIHARYLHIRRVR